MKKRASISDTAVFVVVWLLVNGLALAVVRLVMTSLGPPVR